jgi:hypothetical protein
VSRTPGRRRWRRPRPLYAEATIRPEGSQVAAISSLVERVAGSTAPLGQLPSKLGSRTSMRGYLIGGARIDDGLRIARLVVGLQ